ncbi:MAG TPA: hypothetical protein VN664_05685 [Burkholderiales bacterium]|nr:hypothetical protein [Burkholderiales bacterium]
MSGLAKLPAMPAVLVCLLSFSLEAADVDNDYDPAERGDVVSAVTPSPRPWPTQIIATDIRLVVYQPQFDKWEGNRIEGRAAVAVYGKADEQPASFGMVWISARSETDRATGMVTIRDIAVTKADFPTVREPAGELAVLRQRLAAKTWQMPLERLQADMAIERTVQQTGGQPLKNDPPKIIFSERSAILVPIDGAPVLREVPGTGLQRIVNTRALIVYDPAMSNPASARYYLYVIDHWRQAQHLSGPWTPSAMPAADLEKARQLAVQEDQVDLLDDDVEDGEPLDASAVVYVTTEPAELLQTDGPAEYAPIQGTQLLYVTNSPDRIFLDLRTANHYVLISGRWYRARALQRGPWEYVAAGNLPKDFALIPPDHDTAPVRAAVAGTPQAREAVIANSVPQVATVTRSAARLEITYDGDPSFQPITGTSLQSAINSPVPVIRVSEESFYALDNGVWFTAVSPFGPWSVASYVPAVIYSIPRSSPLHYVTYVRVYDATPEVVYVGYTPGYVGSYVSSDFVVVYGSGWPYQPWIGTVWYGAPVTWGFGFSIVYNWWNPWYYPCCYAAWAPHPHYYRPHWGPWHHHAWHHAPARHGAVSNMLRDSVRPQGVNNIYGRWDRRAVHPHAQNSYSAADRRARSDAHFRPGNGSVVRPDGGRREMGDRDGRRDWNAPGTHQRTDRSPHQRRDSIDGDRRESQRTQNGPGRGFVVGPDGRRQNIGDRNGRRDWKDPGADVRNRAELPQVQRRDPKRPDGGGRRDLAMNEGRDPFRHDDLPRIQTPQRRPDATNMAHANPGRESFQAPPRSQESLAGQIPRPRQDIQQGQGREQATARRPQSERAQPPVRSQPQQFTQPPRGPDQVRERGPRDWRPDRVAPSFPSANPAPARPQAFRQERAQMPRAIPEARAPGTTFVERAQRNIGGGPSQPQFRGGQVRGHGNGGAGPSGPRFGERQR